MVASRPIHLGHHDPDLKLIDAEKELESPWYAIWATALLTGCRNGELFALTWEDIDFTSNSIRVSKSYNKRLRITKSTKAGYWRNIPINSDLKELLLGLKNNSFTEHVLPRIRDSGRTSGHPIYIPLKFFD
jgi:integrase